MGFHAPGYIIVILFTVMLLVAAFLPAAAAGETGIPGEHSGSGPATEESESAESVELSRDARPLAAAEATPTGVDQVATSATPGTIDFFGSGWGHGIGLSQYGAQALASDSGWTASKILNHYYSGSVPGSDPHPGPIWVNLEQELVEVTLTPRDLRDTSKGATLLWTRSPGAAEESFAVDDNEAINIVHEGIVSGVRQCSVSVGGTGLGSGDCMIDITWNQPDNPRTAMEITRRWFYDTGSGGIACTFTDLANASNSLPCQYAYGTMRIRPDDMDEPVPGDVGFNVVVELELDEYARGIAEMPYSWNPEALEAQAVAARSFARYVEQSRSPVEERQWCWCDLYDTSIDQVYRGWGSEDIGNWTAAVDATNGKFRLSAGEAIGAFYTSSNGGATVANEDLWGGVPISYLRSVDDPKSLTSANPFAYWTAPVDTSSVAAGLGYDEIFNIRVVDRFDSGLPLTVMVSGRVGGVTKREEIGAAGQGGGEILDNLFGMRSAHINEIGGEFDASGTYWHKDIVGVPGVSAAEEKFGSALAAGDFNNDGYEDLAIGAPTSATSTTSTGGSVTVIYGSASGLSSATAQRWAQDTSGVPGTAENEDRFGAAVTTGDFDGDGFSDLAIGAPKEGIDDATKAGAVVILFGGSAGLTATAAQIWYEDFSGVAGTSESGDFFGAALASGDIDDDSYDDLVIGVPGEDIGSIVDAGRIEVLYGSSIGITANRDRPIDQSTRGVNGKAEAGDMFGSAIAIGDVNNDGFDDVAIGVPGETVNGSAGAGLVNLLYGTGSGISTAGDLTLHQDKKGVNGKVESGDAFGFSLAIGQLNGSSGDDLIVGVPNEDLNGVSNAGMVQIFFGSSSGIDPADDVALHQGKPGIADGLGTPDKCGAAVAIRRITATRSDAVFSCFRDKQSGNDNSGVVHSVPFVGKTPDVSNDELYDHGSFDAGDLADKNDYFGYAIAPINADGDTRFGIAVGVPRQDIGQHVDAGAVSLIND